VIAGTKNVKEMAKSDVITMFMCGDVMTGRGIDQVLPHPSHPVLYEPYIKDATQYVELAERINGSIPRPADFPYIWGDALEELEREAPDLTLINLETSITKSDDYWRGKGINYRMHPENIPAITAARINFCSLANNHVLDWAYSGLAETLETLRSTNVKSAGAGGNIEERLTWPVRAVLLGGGGHYGHFLPDLLSSTKDEGSEWGQSCILAPQGKYIVFQKADLFGE